MGADRVTVMMITYNRRDEALRSLGHLTRLPGRPPIIVVDGVRRAVDTFDGCPRLAIPPSRVLVGPENREDPVCR